MKYKIDYEVNPREHTLSIGFPNEKFDGCFFIVDKYTFNDRACLKIYSFSEGQIATLTTNLPHAPVASLMDAFLDENNCPGVKDFLVGNGFALDLGKAEKSGYCVYPLVHLHLEKIIPYMSQPGQRAWADYLNGKEADWDAAR